MKHATTAIDSPLGQPARKESSRGCAKHWWMARRAKKRGGA